MSPPLRRGGTGAEELLLLLLLSFLGAKIAGSEDRGIVQIPDGIALPTEREPLAETGLHHDVRAVLRGDGRLELQINQGGLMALDCRPCAEDLDACEAELRSLLDPVFSAGPTTTLTIAGDLNAPYCAYYYTRRALQRVAEKHRPLVSPVVLLDVQRAP